VAWQTEDRKEGKPTKVPYAPDGRKARAGVAHTWGTRPEAETRTGLLPRPYQQGGVGLEFSDLGEVSTGGIDLDSCRDPTTGAIEPWANDLIDRFRSYTEVSPSGTGVKIFFTYTTEDLAKIQPYLAPSKFGKVFKLKGGDHPPAVELYLGDRYFTVTGEMLGTVAELRHVETDLLIELIQVIGPTFKRDGTKADQEKTASNDNSRSALAFSKARELRKSGSTYDQMVQSMLADEGAIGDWAREKGQANYQREFKRLWKNSKPDDAAARNGQGPHLAARQAHHEVIDRLARDGHGTVLATHANLMLILSFDPILIGLAKFSAFTGLHMLQRQIPSLDPDIKPALRQYPRPLDENDITRLLAFVQRSYTPHFAKSTVAECLQLASSDNEYHEVLEYLDRLKWDGRKRLDLWLTIVFGCPNDAYHQAIAAKLLIAAVRRVRQPGCKHDHLVVFEGPGLCPLRRPRCQAGHSETRP
jgi:hypothetical protein